MKKFLLYLIIFLLAVWAGAMIAVDPGYALFAYSHWTVQMPLWIAGALAILIFLILHNSILLIRGTGALARKFRIWTKQHRLAVSHKLTNKGLIELAEGNWAYAEELLIKANDHNSSPLINYLSAAWAAQEQGADDRRDEYLRLAHASTPDAQMAIGLTQAQLQLNHHQLEQGLASLRHIHNLQPAHTFVLKLLKRVYLELKDWESLLELLPELKKRKVEKGDDLLKLERQVYSGLLLQAHKTKNLNLLDSAWQKIPKSYRKDKEVVSVYALALIDLEAFDTAEELLRDTLKNNWDQTLVALYGRTRSKHPEKQLETAEYWLKIHGSSPALLLCLGQLCLRTQLWGKARSYLQDCIALDPNPQAYAELAKLLEYLGQTETALIYYRQGMMAVIPETELLSL